MAAFLLSRFYEVNNFRTIQGGYFASAPVIFIEICLGWWFFLQGWSSKEDGQKTLLCSTYGCAKCMLPLYIGFIHNIEANPSTRLDVSSCVSSSLHSIL